MLTIYNTTVKVSSQEQADRLKQICIDYGLLIAYPFYLKYQGFETEYFGSYKGYFSTWSDLKKQIITESKWMELLTKTKKL